MFHDVVLAQKIANPGSVGSSGCQSLQIDILRAKETDRWRGEEGHCSASVLNAACKVADGKGKPHIPWCPFIKHSFIYSC